MGNKEKSEILIIFNQYKDTLDNLIDSLDNNSDIKLLAILKWIDILSNNILGLENSTSSLKKKNDFSRNKLQEHK